MLLGPTNGVITKTGPGEFSTQRDQTSFAGKWIVNRAPYDFMATRTFASFQRWSCRIKSR